MQKKKKKQEQCALCEGILGFVSLRSQCMRAVPTCRNDTEVQYELAGLLVLMFSTELPEWYWGAVLSGWHASTRMRWSLSSSPARFVAPTPSALAQP
eukprot:3026625-Rhodomonas_salina.2